MIIMCGLPFSFVENEYFIQFCSTLNYKPLYTNTLHTRLQNREKKQDNTILDLLTVSSKKCIMVDGWTGKNVDHYQSLGVRVIDKDWNSYDICCFC